MLSRGRAQAAAQQGAERALPAGLDLQAGGGDGAAGGRRRPRARRSTARGGYPARQPLLPLPRPARLDEHAHAPSRKSCNTYFYTMGRRDRHRAHLGDGASGSASASGSTCRSSRKATARSPIPAWKQRRYRQDWSQADTLNAAIGQGYVILNPLQLAVMAARVASGRDIQPRLILDAASARRRRCPSPRPAFRDGALGHGRGGERRRHRRAQPAPLRRHPDGAARPAPPRCGGSSAASAARPAPPGAIATTACSSSSRRSARRAMPARW